MSVLIVTGFSGAGKSASLKCLEDLGFEAIDNLPLSLLGQTVREAQRSLVLGIDVRTREFSVDRLRTEVQQLQGDYDVRIVYVYSDSQSLIDRYAQSRRHHPLSQDTASGILSERQCLQGLERLAHMILDTSNLSLPELRMFWHQYAAHNNQNLPVSILSFAYPRGLPRQAHMVFDMRFLKNPYYQENLRLCNGRDLAVQSYLEQDKSWVEFRHSLVSMMEHIFVNFQNENRPGLIIAFGCTGGYHRSVFAAENFCTWAQTQPHIVANLHHRDLAKHGES